MRAVQFKVFKSGNSLALRLPASFGFREGEVLVGTREEGALVLKPVTSMGWPEDYFDSWEAIAFEAPERRSGTERETRLRRLFGKA